MRKITSCTLDEVKRVAIRHGWRGCNKLAGLGFLLTLGMVLAMIGLPRPAVAVLDGRGSRENRVTIQRSDVIYDTIWSNSWGGKVQGYGYGIWGDGSTFYTCGSTFTTQNNYETLLVKWNAAGNQIWNRTWGGTRSDSSNSIWGNGTAIYTCGHTYSFGVGNEDMWLARWDASGNRLWNRTWGGLADDVATGVWCDESAVYLTGWTRSFTTMPGYAKMALVKWDAAGNQIWNRTWGGTNQDFGKSVWSDGTSVYTCGYTYSYSVGHADLALVKWDGDGNVAWSRTWGGSDYDIGFSLMGHGTDLYTCGYTGSFDAKNRDMLLVKWNASGDLLWNRTWGGASEDYAKAVWTDGTAVYTCGDTESFGAGAVDMALVRWDANGTQQWNNTWGKSYNDRGEAVWADANGAYTCGHSFASGSANYSLALVKWGEKPLAITSPADVKCTIGGPGKVVSWTITDTTTGERRYTIYRDGEQAANGTWNRGVPIVVSLADLEIGQHAFAINATDGLGESIQDVVVVTVVEGDVDPWLADSPAHVVVTTIVAGGLALIGTWLVIAMTKNRKQLAGRFRAMRDAAARRQQAPGRIDEVLYKRVSTGATCPACGNLVPKGAETEKFCIICGKERPRAS